MAGKGSKKEILAEKVRQTIFSAFFNGEATLNEHALARKLGVSRTPIREILRQLEQEGIIVRRQKKGIVLRKPTRKEILDLYVVREAMELLAVRLATERISDADIHVLEAILEKMEEAVQKDDFESLNHWEFKFHQKIIQVSGNSYLKRMNENLHLLTRAFRFKAVKPRLNRESKFSHGKILQALREKDVKKVQALMADHIDLGRREEIMAHDELMRRKPLL